MDCCLWDHTESDTIDASYLAAAAAALPYHWVLSIDYTNTWYIYDVVEIYGGVTMLNFASTFSQVKCIFLIAEIYFL